MHFQALPSQNNTRNSSQERLTNSTMSAKRPECDLTSSFVVTVGPQDAQRRFTVYSNVLTPRSEFLRASREWLKDNPAKPTEIEDADPDLFSLYLNCVYFGADVVHVAAAKKDASESTRSAVATAPVIGNGFKLYVDPLEHSEAEYVEYAQQVEQKRTDATDSNNARVRTLLKLYLLADRLQDLQTANTVVDELARFCTQAKLAPSAAEIRLAYESTLRSSRLRKYLRDSYVREAVIWHNLGLALYLDEFPAEFVLDVAADLLNLQNTLHPLASMASKSKPEHDLRSTAGSLIRADRCRYHQHDERNTTCKV